MTDRNIGQIEIGNGYQFTWMRANADDEISGMIEDQYGRPMSGTHGWWRTNDPDEAAKMAELVFADRIQ